MKKQIVLVFIGVASLGLFSFVMVAKKGGKAGYTGAPSESACNNCHNSYAINSSNGSIKFSSNIANDLYVPDSIYHLKITVAKPAINLFGFGLEALKPGNTSTGSFIISDPVRTQTLTAANGRPNVVHKLNGGASADSAVFSFDWKAPSTNVGTITFYYSGVCGNGNNSDNLDYTYKGSHSVTSTSTVGIENLDKPYADLEVLPFPNGQLIDIKFLLDQTANVELRLLTMDGKVAQTITYASQDPGNKIYTMYTSNLQSGVYILHAQINEVAVTRKFLLIQ